jgi:hypothetical protein
VLHHGTTPSSIAGEDEHHLQNPTPARLQLHDAAGQAPYNSYAINNWERLAEGVGTGGSPASRWICGGKKNRLSLLCGRRRTSKVVFFNRIQDDFYSWNYEKRGTITVRSAYRMLASVKQHRGD